MTTLHTVPEPTFAYMAHGKPDPLSLFDDLPMVDSLQYLQHIVLAAVGPWAEMLEPEAELPEALKAEAAVISGALMSMADSLGISHAKMDDLMEQLGIAVAQANAEPDGTGTSPEDETHEAADGEANHTAESTPSGPAEEPNPADGDRPSTDS